MKALLILAALASPPAAAPSQPAPPASVQDVKTETTAPKLIDDRRIQLRPHSKKPGSESKPGPGMG